eukprot:g8907.t1
MKSQVRLLRAHVSATFRKNVAYQKRRVCMNACMLVTPLVFILLLVLLQHYIDSVANSPDNRCGCMCILCCLKTDTGNCRAADASSQCHYSTEECRSFDEQTCGFEYSNLDQMHLCSIEEPTIWPAVLDIPHWENRPHHWNQSVVVFTTAEDPEVQQELTRRMFPVPNSSQLLNSETHEFLQNGEWFSFGGVIIGSTQRPKSTNYIESTFQSSYSILSENCLRDNQNGELEMLTDAIANTFSHSLPTLDSDTQHQSVKCINVQLLHNTASEIDRYFYCSFHQAHCNATSEDLGIPYQSQHANDVDEYTQAMDFRGTSRDTLETDVWIKDWNSANNARRRPRPKRANQPINMITNSWIKYVLNNDQYSISLIGLQEVPKHESHRIFELSSIVAILLFTWVIQLPFSLMLVQLVYEKEQHLRFMMKMHGLGAVAYWFVTYSYYLVITILYILILVLGGSLADLVIFTLNDYGVLLLFLVAFGNTQIAFAFLLSGFFKKTQNCIIFSFLWIIGTGFIGAFLVTTLITYNRIYNFFIELIPAFAAYRGFYELGEYAFRASRSNAQGLTWDSFYQNNNHMGYVILVLLLEWPVFMYLAWYLEQVLGKKSRTSRRSLFFLDCFRKPKLGQARTYVFELASKSFKDEPSTSKNTEKDVNIKIGEESVDEAAERRRVETFSTEDAAEHSIIIKKLRKVFPAYEGTPEKVAVKELTMAISRGEVFGLLGPNGAGKTTAINMLTGFLNSTSGTAFVEGHDIGTEMETLYGLMGVCPQHDLLWETLTGYEHLMFYGRLKGLKDEELRESAISALKAVNLFHEHATKKLVKEFSGGMKRRLSVAISFIGNPRVVYLDEPSTGLDPVSRRNLWKVIKSEKQNKAIVLTTHSMEEAEILCDRLGIFINGQLQFIGNPKSLIARYGGYLVFTLITIPEHVLQATELIQEEFPGSIQTSIIAAVLKYEFPSQEVSLSRVFQFMEAISHKIKVMDWAIANITLQEVFTKIAKEAGAMSLDLSEVSCSR